MKARLLPPSSMGYMSVLFLFCSFSYSMLPRSHSLPSNLSTFAQELNERNAQSHEQLYPIQSPKNLAPKTLSDNQSRIEQTKKDTKSEALRLSVLQTCPPKVKRIISVLKEDLKSPVCFPVKAILLVGPPGTGKSTLPQIIAELCGRSWTLIPLIFLGDEFRKSGEQNLRRKIEAIAALETPYIIVLDDAHDLNAHSGSQNPDHGIAVALWELMDEYKNNKNIIFVGTTNNKNNIPPQLRDRLVVIEVPLPNAQSRKIIIQFLRDSSLVNTSQKDTLDKSTPDIESQPSDNADKSTDDNLASVFEEDAIPTKQERIEIVSCLRNPLNNENAPECSSKALIFAKDCDDVFFESLVAKTEGVSVRDLEKLFAYSEWIMIERMDNIKNKTNKNTVLEPSSLAKKFFGSLWFLKEETAPSSENKITKADMEQALQEVLQERKENEVPAWYRKWDGGWQIVCSHSLHGIVFPVLSAGIIYAIQAKLQKK